MLCKERLPCPSTRKISLCIHYTEAGSGFPLLIIPGGGLNSTVAGLSGANSPFNPIHELKAEDRMHRSRLAQCQWRPVHRPGRGRPALGRVHGRQLGLMDHLGIDKFMVMGFCIGGPFIWNLLRRAPTRIVAAVLAQPSGFRPEMPDLFYQTTYRLGPTLVARRPDITMAMVDSS